MSEREVYCHDGNMFLNKRPTWCTLAEPKQQQQQRRQQQQQPQRQEGDQHPDEQAGNKINKK